MFKQLINQNRQLNFQTLFTLSTLFTLNLAKMSATGICSTNQTQDAKPDASYSLSFVTIDTEENGSKLARSIIENDLAACVNIVPQIRSIYKWKGKIEDDKEHLLLIKSKFIKIEELTNFIKKNHPYEVCEVITIPITHGNSDYLKWIDQNVRSN